MPRAGPRAAPFRVDSSAWPSRPAPRPLNKRQLAAAVFLSSSDVRLSLVSGPLGRVVVSRRLVVLSSCLRVVVSSCRRVVVSSCRLVNRVGGATEASCRCRACARPAPVFGWPAARCRLTGRPLPLCWPPNCRAGGLSSGAALLSCCRQLVVRPSSDCEPIVGACRASAPPPLPPPSALNNARPVQRDDVKKLCKLRIGKQGLAEPTMSANIERQRAAIVANKGDRMCLAVLPSKLTWATWGGRAGIQRGEGRRLREGSRPAR